MGSLEKARDEALRNWGHNVLLQRQTPDRSSHVNTLERHTVRHAHPSSVQVTRMRQEHLEGQITDVDMIYYFRDDAEPREGDRIYEEDPRYIGEHGPAGSGMSTWIVDYAIPMRGRNGRLVYWLTGVTREEPN